MAVSYHNDIKKRSYPQGTKQYLMQRAAFDTSHWHKTLISPSRTFELCFSRRRLWK